GKDAPVLSMTIAKWTDFSSLDRERTIAAVNRVAPKWVALVLVVLIAWLLARIVWMLVPGPAAGDPVEADPGVVSQGVTPGSQADVQTIASAHIFGEARAIEEAPPPAANHDDLAETRLNLSLKGTITANDEQSSIAIIADTGNQEKVYAIRDTVVPGTT